MLFLFLLKLLPCVILAANAVVQAECEETRNKLKQQQAAAKERHLQYLEHRDRATVGRLLSIVQEALLLKVLGERSLKCVRCCRASGIKSAIPASSTLMILLHLGICWFQTLTHRVVHDLKERRLMSNQLAEVSRNPNCFRIVDFEVLNFAQELLFFKTWF